MMERPPEAPRMENELSVEEAEKRMYKQVSERIAKGEIPRYASFALPINPEGDPILFERKNDPSAGLYSVVGGKIDESQLTQVSRSSFSASFLETGFETPTNGLLRELDEELYANALAERGLTEPGERAYVLEEHLKPSRKAVVYDAPNNAFNALYLIQTPAEFGIQVDSSVLGKMKHVRDLKPEEINPLTRFFLDLSGYTHRGMEGLTWGRVKHLPAPPDILKAEVKKEALQFSHEPETPSYLLQY